MRDQDTAELRLDEANELLFKIRVQGASHSPNIVRLVCEVGDIAYSFKGTTTNEQDVVRFEVPPLKNSIKSGQTCEARIEVIVDDHYFVPVRFNAHFKEPMNVVAESISSVATKKVEPSIQVQATPVRYKSLREQYKSNKR